MPRTSNPPPVWRALVLFSVLLLLFAFLYRPWLDFSTVQLGAADVYTPGHTFVRVYLGATSYSGIRLLLGEGVWLLALIPAAALLAFFGSAETTSNRRALLTLIAGGTGLVVPTLYVMAHNLAFVEAGLILGGGFWLTVIAGTGLALLGATSLGLDRLPGRSDATPKSRARSQGRLLPLVDWLERAPWWLLVAGLLAILIVWSISSSDVYQDVFNALKNGILTTIEVTIIAYTLSIIVGLLAGLARVSRNAALYHTASFYVEIVRGVPMLVLLYYITFVVGPALMDAVNATGSWMIDSHLLPAVGARLEAIPVRDLTFKARAIIALTLGYGAFLSEIFRAGIESVDRGQMEAARSLGMTYVQAMRYVILPQAIRRVLPPLGNDFIAMLKDSSLIAVLALPDLLQMGRLYASRTFRAFEPYNTVAILYLVMTLILSMLVRIVERKTAIG